MKIEFKNHPAQARHPVTQAPLFDDDDKPIPLFPDMRSIYMDDSMIGYCGDKPHAPVTLIVHLSNEVADAIAAAVEAEFGKPKSVNQPPVIPEDILSGGDEEDE